MEQKHVLLSALSVGVGLGVGLGLSTGQKWIGGNRESSEITEEQIVLELQNRLIDGAHNQFTFENFPYYLCERIQFLLKSAGYAFLKQQHMSKHMRELSPASRAILISGPADLYQQMLARALAHYFHSKLLLLDITDLSLKMQSKYGSPRKVPDHKKSISDLFGSLAVLPSTGKARALLKFANGFCFDEKLFVQSLYKVLVSVSETGPIILYIKDIEKLFLRSSKMYDLFQKLIKKLSGSVLILGSRVFYSKDGCTCTKVDERLTMLFPYNIEIKPPQDKTHLESWNTELEVDSKMLRLKDSKNHIAEVLAAHDVDCYELDGICHADIILLSNHIEEIVVSAIYYHLMDAKNPEYRNGKLVISAKSLNHTLSMFQEGESGGKDTKTKDSNKQVPPDNEFEKILRSEFIPAKEIGVKFSDIGALDDIKESLHELVMLPLIRPDLFKGGLLKPCRGILLFGPPGTGKTMLAKAIANEAGANFINVSMSNITSKYYGEDEKMVRALFSLAAKVAPTIIFVDEVDSLLGKRDSDAEHEATRRIKNEFMIHWDGLLTKTGQKILVLAATNRPFDLDEAVIRRFERRIMVGLPSAENREMILKKLLDKEKCENIDFKEISAMTEGFTGSDLKNLCMTAAYLPVRELLQKERLKDMEKNKTMAEAQSSEDASSSSATKDQVDNVITLRPLNMEDMRQAMSKVAASFAEGGAIMSELKGWNDLYGEGGSRTKKKEQLTYFL